MKYEKCKECNKRYKIGVGSGNERIQHQHGKNNSFYGRKHTRRNKKIIKQWTIDHNNSGHPMLGKRHTKETKRKMKKSWVGRVISEKARESKRKLWRNGVYDNVNFYSSSFYRKDLGHNCRSTWEANFARVLNYLGIQYEYEYKRFITPNGSYCPDFYLPDSNTYIEIKGWEENLKQKYKRIFIRKKYSVRVRLIREKTYTKLKRRFRSEIKEWEE